MFSPGSAVRVAFGRADGERDSKLRASDRRTSAFDRYEGMMINDNLDPAFTSIPLSVRNESPQDPRMKPTSLKSWSFRDRENDQLFAGHGADVVVHADDFHAHGFVDQRFQHRAGQFEQLLTGLLDQVAALFGSG